LGRADDPILIDIIPFAINGSRKANTERRLSNMLLLWNRLNLVITQHHVIIFMGFAADLCDMKSGKWSWKWLFENLIETIRHEPIRVKFKLCLKMTTPETSGRTCQTAV